jgi:hypothetical protein
VVVSATTGGLLVEARAPTTVCGRLVPTGTRRLVRSGERIEGDGWALWPEGIPAPPDGTRAVLAAVLAGVPAAAPAGPWVTVLEGPAAGTRFAVGAATVVGRSRRADATIADPLASRRHLVLERREGATWARDLGSKNGFTLWRREGDGVRARRIRRGRVRLAPGDELEIGGTLVAYDEIESGGASSRPSPREAGRGRERGGRSRLHVPLSCPLPQGGEETRPPGGGEEDRPSSVHEERGVLRAAVLLASIALLVAAALLARAAA